jgi:hypothetical protein
VRPQLAVVNLLAMYRVMQGPVSAPQGYLTLAIVQCNVFGDEFIAYCKSSIR